jgi:MFS family permease
VIGPAIAGILVAKIGEGWCFFANGASYIAVIIGLLLMTVQSVRRPKSDSPIADIVEGFRWVSHTGPIRMLLLLLGLVSLVGMPYTVLMPVFADKILHGGASGLASFLHAKDPGAVRLGVLMGATGVGALLGALTLALRSGVRGLGRLIVLTCAGFGLSLIVFAASKSFWASTMLLIPVGFCIMLQMACSNTLIQTMVPDVLRGRVMSLYSMMFMGMAPFGALLGGALANRLGAPLTIAIGGAASIVGAILFGRKLPVFRGEARQLIIAQAVAGGEPSEEMTVRMRD